MYSIPWEIKESMNSSTKVNVKVSQTRNFYSRHSKHWTNRNPEVVFPVPRRHIMPSASNAGAFALSISQPFSSLWTVIPLWKHYQPLQNHHLSNTQEDVVWDLPFFKNVITLLPDHIDFSLPAWRRKNKRTIQQKKLWKRLATFHVFVKPED